MRRARRASCTASRRGSRCRESGEEIAPAFVHYDGRRFAARVDGRWCDALASSRATRSAQRQSGAHAVAASLCARRAASRREHAPIPDAGYERARVLSSPPGTVRVGEQSYAAGQMLCSRAAATANRSRRPIATVMLLGGEPLGTRVTSGGTSFRRAWSASSRRRPIGVRAHGVAGRRCRRIHSSAGRAAASAGTDVLTSARAACARRPACSLDSWGRGLVVGAQPPPQASQAPADELSLRLPNTLGSAVRNRMRERIAHLARAEPPHGGSQRSPRSR